MNKYLAKSNPVETIEEHTNQLLMNLDILKTTYPNINVDWDMLETACIYHDLGKMNLKFQAKIESGIRYEDEVAHNLLSLAFLNCYQVKEKYNNKQRRLIALAVGNHHNRGDYNANNYNEEVGKLIVEAQNFKYKDLVFDDIRPLSKRLFSKNGKAHTSDKNYVDYIIIKGLLNRLDYAASAGIRVETRNDFLENELDKFIISVNSKWNELQIFMKNNQGNSIIATAQTGMGKTEAGLLWIGNNKGFFTLPLKTAINSIYNRVAHGLLKNDFTKIGLLHSDTFSKYLELKDQYSNLDVDKYVNKTRQLSLPLTICTIDQLFDVVFRYTDYEVKLATLAYSKIVIDEIQMYSPDLIAYLILGLKLIQKVGGMFAILTATLPPLVTYLLDMENVVYRKAEVNFINDLKRHKLKVLTQNININKMVDYDDKKVLVVCNTVKKAQDIYRQLIEEGINAKLFHSKYIQNDRNIKEKDIFEMGQKESSKTGIWVATQIVEASLDIDFDYLFTELSDLNSLFQRMGRCYRKRELDHEEYNCYVYIGDKRPCSGVKYVIDEDIYNFSRESLLSIDGVITEQNKQDMIKEVYNIQRIIKTSYFEEIQSNISAVKSIPDYECDKKDVKEKFRNIDNVIVFPKPVYEMNKKTIDDLVEDYKQLYEHQLNKEIRKEEQARILNVIKGYAVSVRREETRKRLILSINISDYIEIAVLDCLYSKELGISYMTDKDKNKAFEDRDI